MTWDYETWSGEPPVEQTKDRTGEYPAKLDYASDPILVELVARALYEHGQDVIVTMRPEGKQGISMLTWKDLQPQRREEWSDKARAALNPDPPPEEWYAIRRSDGAWYLGEDLNGIWFGTGDGSATFRSRRDAELRAEKFDRDEDDPVKHLFGRTHEVVAAKPPPEHPTSPGRGEAE